MSNEPRTCGASGAEAAIPAGPGFEEELLAGQLKGTPEEIERQWFDRVYRGSGDRMRQLTGRALLMGSVLGGVLSLTNLYVGLKSGWSLGVAITACILSYAIWTALHRARVVKTEMTILENNCMQSTASAAGFSTGNVLVSAFPAYLMLNQQPVPVPVMLAWVFFLALLGVTMAIPMKRQMINVEQLRFPSGVAAAMTLRALHSRAGRGLRSARALAIAGVFSAANAFWSDGLRLVSARLEPYSLGALVNRANQTVFGSAWMGRTVMFLWDPVFLGAGALAGLRVGTSMLIGASLCWAVFVPLMQQHGVIQGSGFRELIQWTVWGGTSCMVTSGLLAFALRWRSAARAFRHLATMLAPGRRSDNELERIEPPGAWFAAGQLVSLLGLAWLGHVTFAMPLWQTALAVLLTFALALVACRVMGETDTAPIGALGKITQLMFGGVSPGNVNVNLMSASITSGAAFASADLLTDLKSGYLLGANPRKQFLAQLAGTFTGTLVTVLAFGLMVPHISALGSDQFPVPAAQAWRAVAVALSHGIGSLEPAKVWTMAAGALVGVLLPLLALLFPKHQQYVPSAAAVGLAWTFHWYYSCLFFLGGLAAHLYQKKAPQHAGEFAFPIASGVIAGGSLMGVFLLLWENAPELTRKLFGG